MRKKLLYKADGPEKKIRQTVRLFSFFFFTDCFYPRKLPQHCREDGMKVEKTRVSVNVF